MRQDCKVRRVFNLIQKFREKWAREAAAWEATADEVLNVEDDAAYMPAEAAAAESPENSSGSRYEFRSPPSILSSEAATPAARKEDFEKLLSDALTPDADGQPMSLEQHDEILALMDQIQLLEMGKGEKRPWGP